MTILGLDPGYAIVGFGVIEKEGSKMKDYGVVNTKAGLPLSRRLKIIYDGIIELIDTFQPDAVAIEELFFNTNTTTGIHVAHARGVMVLACVNKGVPVYEYTPLQVKQALTGFGRAEKKQIQYMVKSVFGLSSIPKPDDAADALAVALTHAQTNTNLTNTTF